MWSYVKGLLLGLVLLWLVLVLSVSAGNGLMMGGIFGFIIVKSAISQVQRSTGGVGLYAALFLILALWIWSFGKNKRKPQSSFSGPTAQAPTEPYHGHDDSKLSN